MWIHAEVQPVVKEKSDGKSGSPIEAFGDDSGVGVEKSAMTRVGLTFSASD